MPVLSARGLSKSYGPQTLFTDVSLTIVRGERVGLLGVNGTGKSTLLRILAGLETPDGGVVERRRDASVLYLAQEPELDVALSPRQIVLSGLRDWQTVTARHAEVTHRIGGGESDDALLALQAELGEQVLQLGGWERGHVADDMLARLAVRDVDRPVGTMSGGEKRRVALAHLLVARPLLAILDEPTNHLDADTIEWLEQYLKDEYEGAVLMVTHDRYALDAICDRTLELDRGKLWEYVGGYSAFIEQKADRLAHEERTEQNRQNLLRRERAWLARGAQARSTKQKARIHRAEALIAADPLEVGPSVDLAALGTSSARLGRTILDFCDVTLELGGRELVSDFTLRLVSGDRIGVVGPNGAGKTTLLRAILKELVPSSGEVVIGERTELALFDQARANLEDDWSVLDNVAELEGADQRGAGVVKLGERVIEMRSYLELFLFDATKQRQKVGSLSGGERARVALAKLLKTGKNLLLLDEPTNDLDLLTLSSLEELLEGWPGALVVVSHDRAFLDRVATTIVAFEGCGRVVTYAGNYSNYRVLKAQAEAAQKKAQAAAPAPRVAPKPADAVAATVKSLSFAEKKELEGLLDRISLVEEKISKLQTTLADPDFYATRADQAGAKNDELQATQALAEQLMTRWEELESRREAGKK